MEGSVLNISVKLEELKTPNQIVLIDDDKFTHLNWKRQAKNNGITLNSFYSIDDFIEHRNNFSSDIQIYVDSNLDNGLKGEVESKKIFDKGFENIYLATGAKKEDIQVPFWIKRVQGKGLYF